MKMNKDLLTGILFMAIALAFGLVGVHYKFGTYDDPGAALFPVAVSVFLFAVGIIKLILGFVAKKETIEFEVKNIAIISSALLLFAVASDRAGILAGTVALVAVASLSASSYSIARVVKIITGLAAVALTFKYLLGLNLPL
jgi:hypothetical protein